MLKRVKKAYKKLTSNMKISYRKYRNEPIDEKLVMLEAGQGSNINGNMFAMLREINTNPCWSGYKTVFVVTENTIDKAKSRMKFYGFDNVILTLRNTDAYCKYLATAKYILTDNSYPPYFNKREGQVYMNTWHGTPLKTLGKSDKSSYASPSNIQKNYLMSDYALFPNEFTREVFMDDYDLRHIFNGTSLIANYPRNYVFYDKQQAVDMKKKLGYDGKKVFAYMPTWRGTGRSANIDKQLEETTALLDEFDSKLDDNTVLLVNLHFLLASNIDCSKYKHIESFNEDYDTYEILNSCDGLLTDYSSVFFDYAVTEKKIILFAYDKEDYLSTRGTYIPFEELPFPITETVDDTIKEMAQPVKPYDEFVKEYCPNGSVQSCCDLFRLMVDGSSEVYQLDKNEQADNICLIYTGSLPQTQFENIREYVEANPEYKYVVSYRGKLNKAKKEYISSMSELVVFYGMLTAFQYTISEAFRCFFKKLFKTFSNSPKLAAFFDYEASRLFYSIKPKKVVDFSCGNFIISGVLNSLSGDKEFITHGDYYCVSDKRKKSIEFIKEYEKAMGFAEKNNAQLENESYLERTKEDIYCDKSFRKNSNMFNVIPFYMKRRNRLKCVSLFRFNSVEKTAMSETFLTIGDKGYDYKLIGSKNRKARKHWGIMSFVVPVEDVLDMPANNKIILNYKNSLGKIVQCHIVYFAPLGRIFLGFRSRILRELTTNTVAVFRQSTSNHLNLYVRSFVTSDKFIERLKQDIAFVVSLFWFGKKAKSLVLLYEKNSSKYEESASALYEKLLDSGYKYSYFIVAKEAVEDVPEKYRKNLLYKNSFKHYLYFFKSKTFIGTETMVHSIDLKLFNRLALAKISSKNRNYVFLQHGVMYMVSLDSEVRYLFRRQNLKGKYRVVVSSEEEANHFITLGKHLPEDLYITGLPKFDKNVLNDDADKIIIMPTWRPWEINTARDNFLETSYFKMIMRIYNSVPDELKDKVIILPHPLIINELKNIPESVSSTIRTDVKYDNILRQARILITDYSSIAYDAFYRGTRVIFYWEEKDDCMAQYGPSTKLMLNEQNVYGDFFYNTDGLRESIEKNYYNPQEPEYVEKYRKIVQFHDGKNTDRLVNFLKRDGII